MHKQRTKRFKEDGIMNSDDLMSSTSSVSIGSENAHSHQELGNLSQKDGPTKQMSLLGVKND